MDFGRYAIVFERLAGASKDVADQCRALRGREDDPLKRGNPEAERLKVLMDRVCRAVGDVGELPEISG